MVRWHILVTSQFIRPYFIFLLYFVISTISCLNRRASLIPLDNQSAHMIHYNTNVWRAMSLHSIIAKIKLKYTFYVFDSSEKLVNCHLPTISLLRITIDVFDTKSILRLINDIN